MVLVESKLYGHPLAGLFWEKQFEEAFLDLGKEKIQTWEWMYVRSSKTRIVSVSTKMAGKNQNMTPMWKKLMNNVDIDEPTSFLDHVFLRCTQLECNPNERIIEQHKKVFGSRISVEQQKNYRARKNLEHKPKRGPTTWKDMVRNALNDTVNWKTIKLSNCTQFHVLVWMIINSSRRNSNQLEKCEKFARKLSWNTCTWHELDDLPSCGRSTSLRDESQNGFRHGKDVWQSWIRKIITQTTSYNIVMSETWRNIEEWDLEDSTSISGGVLCILEAKHWSQWVGCARIKLLSRTVPESLTSFLWMPDCWVYPDRKWRLNEFVTWEFVLSHDRVRLTAAMSWGCEWLPLLIVSTSSWYDTSSLSIFFEIKSASEKYDDFSS